MKEKQGRSIAETLEPALPSMRQGHAACKRLAEQLSARRIANIEMAKGQEAHQPGPYEGGADEGLSLKRSNLPFALPSLRACMLNRDGSVPSPELPAVFRRCASEPRLCRTACESLPWTEALPWCQDACAALVAYLH